MIISSFYHYKLISTINKSLKHLAHCHKSSPQCNAIENIQKHAIHMIYYDTDTLILAGMDSLKDRREMLMARFFWQVLSASNAPLHYLLPEPCDNDTIRNLRNS